jgi:hypothetical protein
MSETALVRAVTCFVPGKLSNPLNGSLSRAHWRYKSAWAKEWKQKAAMLLFHALDGAKPDLTTPKRVTFVAHVGKLWDTDNLPAGIKPLRDALIGLVIHDDGPTSGHVFAYEQVVDGRRGVEITVEPLP